MNTVGDHHALVCSQRAVSQVLGALIELNRELAAHLDAHGRKILALIARDATLRVIKQMALSADVVGTFSDLR